MDSSHKRVVEVANLSRLPCASNNDQPMSAFVVEGVSPRNATHSYPCVGAGEMMPRQSVEVACELVSKRGGEGVATMGVLLVKLIAVVEVLFSGMITVLVSITGIISGGVSGAVLVGTRSA